jgi:hypothetical protein
MVVRRSSTGRGCSPCRSPKPDRVQGYVSAMILWVEPLTGWVIAMGAGYGTGATPVVKTGARPLLRPDRDHPRVCRRDVDNDAAIETDPISGRHCIREAGAVTTRAVAASYAHQESA